MRYERPPFWRAPCVRKDPDDREPRDFGQRTLKHLLRDQVTPGTPAGKELLRGDIIAKIDDYDARDLRHQDAQNLFRNAGNQIRIVVQRGAASPHVYAMPRASSSYVGRSPTPTFYHEFAEDADRDASSGRLTPMAPRSPIPSALSPSYRTQSPLPPAPYRPGPESLPRSPLPDDRYMLSPVSTRTDDTLDESIHLQVSHFILHSLSGSKDQIKSIDQRKK